MRPRVLDFTLYTAFVVATFLFLMYFIILGNAHYILYSFVFFLFLSVVLATHKRYLWYSIIGALLSVAVGVLFYITLNESYGINISIIGYYLLLSVLLAVYEKTLAQKSRRIKKLAAWTLSGFSRWRDFLYAAVIVSLLVVLVSPLWPIPTLDAISLLPHVPIEIHSNSNASLPGSIRIVINASKYVGVESAHLDNIRFLYANGTEIYASLYSATPLPSNDVRATLYIGNTGKSELNVDMYFIPFANVIYTGNYLILATNANQTNSTHQTSSAYSSSFQRLILNQMVTNLTETRFVYTTKLLHYVQNSSVSFLPYYTSGTICPQSSIGNNESLTVTANRSVSIFLQTTGEFVNSTVIYDKSLVSYPYYIDRFSAYSKLQLLNRTNVAVNLSLGNECNYYTVVADSKTSVNVSYSDWFSAPNSISTSLGVPSVLTTSYVPTFLPESFEALIGIRHTNIA